MEFKISPFVMAAVDKVFAGEQPRMRAIRISRIHEMKEDAYDSNKTIVTLYTCENPGPTDIEYVTVLMPISVLVRQVNMILNGTLTA